MSESERTIERVLKINHLGREIKSNRSAGVEDPVLSIFQVENEAIRSHLFLRGVVGAYRQRYRLDS